MIIKDKKESKIKAKSKILVLGFIFVITILAVGFFSWTEKADAQTAGSCSNPAHTTQETCLAPAETWTPAPKGETAEEEKKRTAMEDQLKKYSCTNLINFSVEGCVIILANLLLITVPSLLLGLSGMFFDAIAALSLHSDMYSSAATFISSSWKIVRDLSNIFFILILLYIAIKIIMDLAGHEAKKMIARVIIMALLINFSMFFTKVVIDSSNVLALVFYNKIIIKTNTKDGHIPATKVNEKPLSSGLAGAFNPSKLLSSEFFEKAKIKTITTPSLSERVIDAYTSGGALMPVLMPGMVAYRAFMPNKEVPTQLMIGIIVVSGLIILFATYAFLVAGLSFLGRLIELWVLIIFSPFAFMSFVIPELAGVDYIGWDAWIKRLVSVSFMAPIFMFFMYFIFLLVNANMFSSLARVKESDQGTFETILFVIIPALVVLILLLKATEFAKKGSGKLGEVIMSGAKLVGGFALGAATGGASLALTNTMGAHYEGIANDDNLKKQASGDKNHFAKMGIVGEAAQKKAQAAAQKKLATANKYANKSFDVRDTGIGKFAAKQTGMDFNKGTSVVGVGGDRLKGGRQAQTEHKIEEEQKKLKTYEMSGSEAIQQNKRADEYGKDEETATNTAKDKANDQNERAAQYEKDKEKAETFAKEKGFDFKEENFKEDYEHGENLKEHGLDKKVEAGSVDKVKFDEKGFKKGFKKVYEDGDKKKLKEYGIDKDKDDMTGGENGGEKRTEDKFAGAGSVAKVSEINNDRKKAYTNSLVDKAELEKAKGAMTTLFSEFKENVKKMAYSEGELSKTRIAATVAATVATGGVAPLAFAAGSFLDALRTTVNKTVTKKTGFGNVKSTNAQVIAGVRKGEDPNKGIIKELKKLQKTEHTSNDKLSHIANDLHNTQEKKGEDKPAAHAEVKHQ